MTINKLDVPESLGVHPRIAVIGVGGGGGNTVNHMAKNDLSGVDLIAANTDTQDLSKTGADFRLQLGPQETGGFGAGTDAEIGRKAAEESAADIHTALDGVSLAFLTAGMGGGTGTGALPVIGRIARELNVLTVGVVTKPFNFEGELRMQVAGRGITEAARQVDTLLVIANQNLLPEGQQAPSLLNAFKSVDDVLLDAVRGVVDLVVRPGLVNLDFADLSMVLRDGGIGVIGAGEAAGPDRGMLAAQRAADNRLLDGIRLNGARSLLINVTGGDDLDLSDMDAASKYLGGLARKGVRMKIGATHDPAMADRVRVYIAASGVDTDLADARAGAAGHVRRTHRNPRRSIPGAASTSTRPQNWSNNGILNQGPKQGLKVRVVGSAPVAVSDGHQEGPAESAPPRTHPGREPSGSPSGRAAGLPSAAVSDFPSRAASAPPSVAASEFPSRAASAPPSVAASEFPSRAASSPPPAAVSDLPSGVSEESEGLWGDDLEIDAGSIVAEAPQEAEAAVSAPAVPAGSSVFPGKRLLGRNRQQPSGAGAPGRRPAAPWPQAAEDAGAVNPPVRPEPHSGGPENATPPEAGAEDAGDEDSTFRSRRSTQTGKGLITRMLAAG